jgi:hypothetical protein
MRIPGQRSWISLARVTTGPDGARALDWPSACVGPRATERRFAMSQQNIEDVIHWLMTDESVRIRFALDRFETIGELQFRARPSLRTRPAFYRTGFTALLARSRLGPAADE